LFPRKWGGATKRHRLASPAALGAPVLGDTLYGAPGDERVWLHAASLALRHPISAQPLTFEAPPDQFGGERWSIQRAMLRPEETDLFRLRHGGAGGAREYIDCLGDTVLAQTEGEAPRDVAASARIGQRIAYRLTTLLSPLPALRWRHRRAMCSCPVL
jgi:hypothetical protein